MERKAPKNANWQGWYGQNRRSLRVAASYLLIIMAMSIGFSLVLYHTSAHELGRQLPPDRVFGTLGGDFDIGDYHAFFQQRIAEGRGELVTRLIWINIFVLLLGALISYWLARRTLQPIENALEAQSRFAADASHELRTPLAAIQTENEVALRNPRLSLARAKELLASNLEEVIRLRGLSEGLLKLARDDGPLKLQPIALGTIANDAVAHIAKAAEAKKIVIESDLPDIKVLADLGAASQALAAILDNAVKYSADKSTVHIIGGKEGREGYISVVDEGPGIAKSDLPHIFERFYRADPSRSKQNTEGHGLGLALAAKIAQQLHGEITATSRPGKGATFTLKLPLIKNT